MKQIKHLITIAFILCAHLDIRAQSNFKNLTEKLPSYTLSVNLEEIVKNDTISIESHNEIFLNYPRNPEKIRPFFYGIDGIKKSDGNVGRLSKSFSYLDQHDEEATYHNKVFPLGLLPLSEDYFSVVLRKEVFDFISISLYNFNKDGILLSAIKLFEYSRNIASEGDEVQYILIKSDIGSKGVIHQRTEADFIIDRKFVLDSDGHFRVIEEEVKDFK